MYFWLGSWWLSIGYSRIVCLDIQGASLTLFTIRCLFMLLMEVGLLTFSCIYWILYWFYSHFCRVWNYLRVFNQGTTKIIILHFQSTEIADRSLWFLQTTLKIMAIAWSLSSSDFSSAMFFAAKSQLFYAFIIRSCSTEYLLLAFC